VNPRDNCLRYQHVCVSDVRHIRVPTSSNGSQRVPTGPNGSPHTCRCVCRRFLYVFVVLWRCIIQCISIACVLHRIHRPVGTKITQLLLHFNKFLHKFHDFFSQKLILLRVLEMLGLHFYILKSKLKFLHLRSQH
jgi:hypothetical protein